MTRHHSLRDLLTRPPGPHDAATHHEQDPERCDLCGGAVHQGHRHLLELEARELRCACRACALLFGPEGAGGDRYRLVPDRRWLLRGFALDDAVWESFDIPVRMAFSFFDSSAGRMALFYPSPLGPVESGLDAATWSGLVTANPVLHEMAHDVEALLVNRTGDNRDHWLVPVDDCYALVGLIRTGWKGLAGGPEVWRAIAGFFTDLHRRAKPVDLRQGGRP